MSNGLLSANDLQLILEKRFKTKNIQFISYELKPISEYNEGFMGDHFNLIIKYKTNDEILEDKLFLKQKPTSEIRKSMAQKCHCYLKEINFFNLILKEFEKFGFDVSFSAKSYHCIPDEAIIMENLVAGGYSLLERNVSFDMDKIKCVLRALALLHGAGFAYEKTKSKQLGKNYKLTDDFSKTLQEIFFTQYFEDKGVTEDMFNGGYKTLLHLIKLLKLDEEQKEQFLKLWENYKIGKIFVDETNLPKTIGHGDLWSNNIMFKIEKNIVKTCCLVDYQIIRYFYPAYDVILSIFLNTDAEFRKKHLNNLYEYYYQTLKEILNNYGYSINEIMTLDQFQASLKLVKVECLIHITILNSFICIPKDIISNALKNDDQFDEVMFNTCDRSVQAFKTNEKYRNILTDNILDLYNALVESNNN